jgi:predicted flap endonuclease-1-like 5' DNA nuclease
MPDVAADGFAWGLETRGDPGETASMMSDVASPLPLLLLAVAGGLILGLLIGRLAFGGAKRLSAALIELASARTERDAKDVRITALERELAQARDQVRPLSDEVDRFRREAAQRKAARAGTPVPEEIDAPATPDTLTLLKGVGDKFAAKLAEMGVTSLRQVAAWTPDEAAAVDVKLDSFAGRVARDQLVEQALLLVAGRNTEYEARFGKVGS